MTFSDVRCDVYTMTEAVPAGYTQKAASWTVTVALDSNYDVKVTCPTFTADKKIVNDQVVGALELLKKDQKGVLVAGAVFGLVTKSTTDGSTPTFADYTTKADGVVKFENLVEGVYTLTEKSAPDYYKLSNPRPTWTVTAKLNDAKTEMKVTVKDSKGAETTVIENEQLLGSLEFAKKDQLGDNVDGAVFQLKGTAADGSKYDETATSKNGKVLFENIKYSTEPYELTETKVPDGYVKLDTKWTVTTTLNNDKTAIIVSIVDPADKAKVLDTITNKRILGEFEILKRGNESATSLLAGAVFTLYGSDGATKVEKESVNGSAPQHNP